MDLNQRISDAMHRIEDLYYSTDGRCYLSFSGGKDSTVILAIIKMCEEIYTIPKNSIPAVFSNTGIELGATIDFVKWVAENYYGNVQIIRPTKSFDSIVKEYGKPIKSKMKSEFLSRYHRGIRTENTVKNLLGERMAEGGARGLNTQKRINEGGKLCTKTKGNYTVKLPIIDWTDEDVEQFIKEYNVPLSKAYTEQGYERTGCFLCPFSLQLDKNLEKLYRHEPNRYKASMHWLKDVYIAQNVVLPFDKEYERERKLKWENSYESMRNEMLMKYRPNSKLCKDYEQLRLEVL